MQLQQQMRPARPLSQPQQAHLSPPPGRSSRALVCAPVRARKAGKQQDKASKRGKAASPQPQPLPSSQPVAAPTQPAAQDAPQQPQPQQQPPKQQPPPTSGLQETPQVVVDRMFKRVVTFAGLPVLTGMALFPLFWYLRVVQKIEYPVWVVYVTQAAMFGGGLLGISYGILSTSWDPRREGTALGWTELRANLPILLNKSKEEQQQ